jgi:ABC-type uncharacterized transport system YnjBCD ATPase subunit
MSTSEGAFDATVPVATHIPGGGSASMSFRLALRILLDADEVLVEVRVRCLLFELSWGPSGCGKGTGVEISAGDVDCEFQDAIVVI